MSVTDMAVISNGHKEPVTDRALISNGFYEPATDRFNLCNALILTSVTKNSLNVHLRSPLPEDHIGNGRVVDANAGVGLPRLWVMCAKQQSLQM
jgi:hypothetical protein